MKPAPSGDITRIVLIVLLIGVLLAGSFLTLLPFLGALIWATTIVVATWPAMIRLQQATGGRRGVAVAVMTLLILAILIVPLAFAISALLDAAWRSPAVMQDFMVRGLGPPPEWIDTIPFVGRQIAARWQEIAAGGPEALAAFARPYARDAAGWAIAATGGVGALILQFLLIVVLTAILYAKGEVAAAGALAFGRRIGDERGERTIRLAGQAVRSVALGVVVTALVQSILAGAALRLTGVPHAGLLTALIFVLCIAQVGPVLVVVPAIAWLYWTGSAWWGTALVICAVPVLTLDNILRPILIRRGVQLPMLLIIGGVIGGLVSFGVLGLFVGPVILASTYTLAKAWVVEGLTAGTSEP
jgi:predicted PurR-regulated permease PerM